MVNSRKCSDDFYWHSNDQTTTKRAHILDESILVDYILVGTGYNITYILRLGNREDVTKGKWNFVEFLSPVK